MAVLALKKDHEVYCLFRKHAVEIGVPLMLDITDGEKLLKTVFELKPQAIIHTAAYTDVDGCEANKELAWRVNAEATRNIAEASAENGSHMVYVSTDYVFDGEKGLYLEEDQPNPVNYYGFTKLKGEEFVKKHAWEWCIARTSVVYGWSLTGKLNFATWVINSLKQGREVKALTDQYVSPTLNTNLAEMLLEISERKITEVLHTAGATRVSRHEYALKLAEAFSLEKELVKPATMREIPWKARRPRDSSLNICKALNMLNAKPLSLGQALRDFACCTGFLG